VQTASARWTWYSLTLTSCGGKYPATVPVSPRGASLMGIPGTQSPVSGPGFGGFHRTLSPTLGSHWPSSSPAAMPIRFRLP
jgi:hypothetical protein